MVYTRRDVAKIALASLPLAKVLAAKPNSKIGGVQIGAISYSFRQMPEQGLDDIIKYMTQIGLSEIELMSNHAENGAGAPPQPRPQAGASREQMRAAMQEYNEVLRKWRTSISMDKFKEVRKKFDEAGIELHLLCYNMQDRMTDDEIEYGFQLAKALGAKAISTSTTITMSKRIAPLADKHKMMVGYHGHDQTSDPNQFATLESYATAFSYGKYNGVNLDIGHFTASNYDAVAFIKEHHARITNLHLKDRKKNHGPNTVWGEGDTPLKDVLLLLKENRYPFPGNIEYEYKGTGDPVAEVAKCYEYCKKILA